MRTGACRLVPRLLTLVVLAPLALALWVVPALAHGVGGAESSNYRSRITGVVAQAAQGGQAHGAGSTVDGLTWRVLAADAYLELTNQTHEEAIVYGYQGEPYLRIGPNGTFENRKAPATYQNTDRYQRVDVPPEADADAEPDWVKLSDQPVHAWHDHRIHWMAFSLPPQVKLEPEREQMLYDWTVPFSLGDRRLAVTGELWWIPGPSPWPWIAVGTVLPLAPVAVVLARSGQADGTRRLGLLRTGAVVLAGVAMLDIVQVIDEMASSVVTGGEMLIAAAPSAVAIALAGVASRKAWSGGPGASIALAVGAIAISVTFGAAELPVLSVSQVVTSLPDPFSRLVIAVSLMSVVPVAIVALAGYEPASETDDAPPSQTAATQA